MYDNPWYPEPVKNPQYQPPRWWSSTRFFAYTTIALIAFPWVMAYALLLETVATLFCLAVITGYWRITDAETEWPDNTEYPKTYSNTKDLGWK